MPHIAEGDTYTEIIVFQTDDAAQQERLLAAVTAQVEGWVRLLPGFVSASFHRSTDGKRVANYAQWRSRADWEAFTRDPRSKDIGQAIHSAEVRGGQGHGYSVAHVVTAGAAEEPRL